MNEEKEEIVIRNKVNELKNATLASDRQLSKRFKRSLYWVRKSTGRENRKRIEGRRIRSERVPFKKIRGRAAAVIMQMIRNVKPRFRFLTSFKPLRKTMESYFQEHSSGNTSSKSSA